MNKGPFAFVQFKNNQTSVVPAKWLFRDDSTNELLCYWTCSRRRVLALESPNPNWPIWPVVRVIGRRETFDEADELSDSWNSDAWNSDACLSDIPKKGDLFPKSATRIKKRKFLSDDEDVEPDDVLNRKEMRVSKQQKVKVVAQLPPAPVFKERIIKNDDNSNRMDIAAGEVCLPSTGLLCSPSPSNGSLTADISMDVETESTTAFNLPEAVQSVSNVITAAVVYATPKSTGSQSRTATEGQSTDNHTPCTGTRNQPPTTRSPQGSNESDVLPRILHLTEETRMMVMQCKQEIEFLKVNIGSSGSARSDSSQLEESCVEWFREPLKDIEKVEELNDRLNDRQFYKHAVTYLAVTSGRDLAEKSRNIVKKLMTDTVQSLYNYEGRGMKQKKPLKTLTQIISLIYDAVRKSWCGPERVDGKVVRQAVAECLKHAKQREQRRLATEAKSVAAVGSANVVEDDDSIN